MDIGTLRGLGTLIILAAFIGMVFWVYRKAPDAYAAAANLPLADADKPTTPDTPQPHSSRSTDQ